MFFDHRFHLAGYQGCTSLAAPFPRSQRAGPPTLFGQTLYPAPDRRPADTKLPNGVIDATFKAGSSFKVYLDKRTQYRGPARLFSTSGNGVFAIIIHQYLPREAPNPVSGLRTKISELKTKSHIKGQSVTVDFVGFLISQLRATRQPPIGTRTASSPPASGPR